MDMDIISSFTVETCNSSVGAILKLSWGNFVCNWYPKVPSNLKPILRTLLHIIACHRGPMHIELKEMITFVLFCRLESLSKLTCFPIRLCLNIGHFWELGWVGFGPAWTYFCLEKVKRFPSTVLTVVEPHIRSINKEGSFSLLGGLPCLHIINAFNSLVNRCIQLIASI